MATKPPSPSLSESQLAKLAGLGEERTAAVGDVLFRVGDATYPFIAIREGEVAILDAAGNEIIRHGASSFLGELNLLSGQTVFLTAVVTKPLRYVAVDRDVSARRCSTTDRSATSSSRRSSPAGRRCSVSRGSAWRSSARGRPRRRCGCSTSSARTGSPSPGRTPARRTERSRRSSGFRAARSCSTRQKARCCGRSGSAASSRRTRKSTCSWSAAAPPGSPRPSTAPPRGSRR